MQRNRQRGATLSLVALVTFIVIMLGFGLFCMLRLVCGTREVQHAVDSGNLNVAKQALVSPTVNVFASSGNDLKGPELAAVRQNFTPLKDPNSGELDLLVYNRLVAQTMLVSMNAASDNFPGPPNPQGIANAKALVDLLANPKTGIGTILANKLKADTAMDNNFASLAKLFPVGMIDPNGPRTQAISSAKEIAYMVPSFATNLQMQTNVIPAEFTAMDPNFYSNSTIADNGNTYLKGYNFFNIPSITDVKSFPLMGVPMRPMEKPHLVSWKNFHDLQSTPLPGDIKEPAISRIPPNAFKSAGFNPEDQYSPRGVQTLSCSIVGTVNLQGQYPPSIPCGFIVVANGAGSTPINTSGPVTVVGGSVSAPGYGGGVGDIFSDVLMYNTVYVTKNGAMAESLKAIQDIQQYMQNQAAKGQAMTPVPANLANAIDGPSPKQSFADGIDPYETPAACDNHNSAPGSPGTNPQCANNLSSMASVYGTNLPSGGNGTTVNGLIGTEAVKALIINGRPGGGPVDASFASTCTGLKSFPLAGITGSAPTEFGGVPSVGAMVAQFKNYGPTSGNGSTIYNQIVTKLYQMRPTSKQTDIDTFLASAVVPLGQVRYLWVDLNGSFQCTGSSGLPSWINPNSILPDGTAISADTGWQNLDGTFVNLDGEAGFPHPWDCSGGPAQAKNDETWTRSSGYNCLQGVLRFSNCARDGGGLWHCPC